jgi:hypothetical protein
MSLPNHKSSDQKAETLLERVTASTRRVRGNLMETIATLCSR